ncbi:MAG: AmmeMemoRadiSam system radical SAM enzyme [Bacteroidales bacterium]|nr:AmmeMemoRadiSam system radical SAM enzyme [Bacteroidales bacterium]
MNELQQSKFKEAKHWEKVREGVVKCKLCPHECILKNGDIGICKARKNINGTLYALTYNKPVSINIDPIEKKPLYHFFPTTNIFSIGTAGCNFSCLNCQNWQISQFSPLEIKSYNYTPEEIVDLAIKNNCPSIAFTYNEPIIFYEYMYDIAVLAKKKGLKTVIVSNGYINEKPLLELIPYIDAANIDLKNFSDSIYRSLNGGTLHPVLNTLKLLKKHNVWLEITNLIVPTYTDDLKMIEEMAKWLVNNGFSTTPLHFSRFFPAYKLTSLYPTPLETIKKAVEIAKKAGIRYVYEGNILQKENTVCPKCGFTLIERYGYNVKITGLKDGKCAKCGMIIEGVWK